MPDKFNLKLTINTSFEFEVFSDSNVCKISDPLDKAILVNNEIRKYLETHISEIINRSSIEVIDIDNTLFPTLGPLSGDALMALNHCINKNGKKSTTLPNRL